MTQIKDVIHLHLGCEVLCNYNGKGFKAKGILSGKTISEQWEVIHEKLTFIYKYNLKNIKPILRRLDSMTEDEAMKLCSLYSPEAFGDYRFSKWVAVKDEANFCYNVTNKNSDMSFSVDLEKMHIKVYEGGNDTYPGIENHTYFAEYLKMGFDVFGLIPSGQAIDKNLKP